MLVTSVAAAALSMAGQAAAFAPVWPADGDAANGTDPAGSVVIWHSGATASTFSLQTAVVEAFCDVAQPVDLLEDARVVGKPDFWSVACIGKATLPATMAGKKILWSKRDEGGSGTGVGPLATNKFIGFMKPSTGAGTNCPAVSGTKAFPGVTANLWNCTGFNVPAVFNEASPTADGVSRVADIGTSDIEPDKFTSAFNFNVPATDFDLDGVRGPTDTDDILAPHDANGLVKEGVAQLLFNTPVNLLMYQDLQRAQFPTGHPLFNDCNPLGATYGSITSSSANANAEKCMPSLSSHVIRSTFAKGGAIRSSLDLRAETSYGSGIYAELLATTNGATDNTIQICRRVNGSGTQAQFNAMHLGYPCDATFDGGIDTLQPEGESILTSFVTEGESSGDVEKCTNDFNNGTNTSGKNAALRKRWAIGIQSLEKNAPSGAGTYTNPYRFIKIDGFAPTLVNAHAGQYFNFGTQSLQYKAGAPTITVDAFNALKPFIQDPLKLPSLNKTHAFGVSGWLATPSATVTPDSALSFTRPVAWFRRVSFSNVPNTCALPTAFKKSGTPGTDIVVGPSNCSSEGGADNNCYTP
jgi:hypothetical protein